MIGQSFKKPLLSPTLYSRRKRGKRGGIENGFTLIELLIVIVIISIIASFAVLSININQNKKYESLANQLVNLITLTEQEAMLQPATLGFSISSGHFQLYNYHPQKDEKENPWRVSDSTLTLRNFPNDVQVTVKTQTKASSKQPQVIISGSGDITPFTIYIGKKGEKPSYQITGEANGNIKTGIVHEE